MTLNLTRFLNIFVPAWLLFFAGSCVSTAPPDPASVEAVESSHQPPEEQLQHSVFLLGDGGGASIDPLEPTLQVLHNQLMKRQQRSSVVFLGDNAYPDGLSPSDAEERPVARQRLLAQLSILDDYTGNIIFLPGNHDWNSSGEGGLKSLQRQEQFVESYLNSGNTFLPDSGRPGPAEVRINKEDTGFRLKIIALDTQWWLHSHEKPMQGQDEAIAQNTFISEVETSLQDTSYTNKVIVAHHPLYSKGPHGGNFPAKTHLVPPIGGSLYVLYRNLFGTPQDIAHSRYQQLARQLKNIFQKTNPLIYASGHDHSLQYIRFDDKRRNQHYINSGSASRTSYAASVEPPLFSRQIKGFAVLKYYKESVWAEYWSENGKRLFEQEISSE